MDKQTIEDFFNQIDTKYKAPELSYTDLIAVAIKEKLSQDKDIKLGQIKWDIHPEEGHYLSSKKSIDVEYNNKMYNITITEK